MLYYKKKGWNIYTDMPDVNIPGVRIIKFDDLKEFKPEKHSCLFLDEVGISMDNRNYKAFPPGLRDFFKYARKMKVKIFVNSQSYDVDKKVRDCVDNMILQTSLFGFLSLSRPIVKRVTLTEPVGDSESKITDKLEFKSFLDWRIYYMPRYFKYFNSLSMPDRYYLPYTEIPSVAPTRIEAHGVTKLIGRFIDFCYNIDVKISDFFHKKKVTY